MACFDILIVIYCDPKHQHWMSRFFLGISLSTIRLKVLTDHDAY